MRWWLFRFGILGVVLALLVGASIPLKSYIEQKTLPKYLTAKVSHGRVETVVNSTGTVKPVRTVSVGAFTSGPVAEVNVNYNSKVLKAAWFRPPTMLARIDPKLALAAVDSQRAAVESMRAAVESQKAALLTQKADNYRVNVLLDQAQKNWKRAKELHGINKDYLSPTEMDQYEATTLTYVAQDRFGLASITQAEANLRQADANLRQAEASLRTAEENLGYTLIVAPEDGLVIERKVDPGQTVAASFQTPELFTIGVEMDQHMHIYASVDEADMGMIRAAKDQKRPVKFTVDAWPGELFEGRVDQIRLNSSTTQNVVTYPVIIETANPNLKLMPGMTANISFEIEAKENVLRVPAAALRFTPLPYQVRPEDRQFVEAPPASGGENAPKRTAGEKADQARNRQNRRVWVQDGLLLRAVPITLGLIDNQFAEVIKGDLTDGQAVVTGTENLFGTR